MNIVMNGIYFLDTEMAQIIQTVGGLHDDQKERPVVALIPSTENSKVF